MNRGSGDLPCRTRTRPTGVLLFLSLAVVAFGVPSLAQNCATFQDIDTRYPSPLPCVSKTARASCGPHGTFAGPCNCTCACEPGYGGVFCDKTITRALDAATVRPQSPFGFSRVLSRRGKYQTFDPFLIGIYTSPPEPAWLWRQEFNQGDDAMMEYTVEMWVLPIFNESQMTDDSGFTLWEHRWTPQELWPGSIADDGEFWCYPDGTFLETVRWCDLRRVSLMWTRKSGLTWNYFYQMPQGIFYVAAMQAQEHDRQRTQLKSGVPFHIAFVFEVTAGATIGPKRDFDDQVATIYLNGVMHSQTLVFRRRFADRFTWHIGSWRGVHPNQTADTFVTNSGIDVAFTSQGIDALVIDEFRLWRTPRSQNEIITTMHHPINSNNTDLFVYWNFDDANATMAANSVPSFGPDWNGYMPLSRPADKYFGEIDWAEGIFPLFEESFVPQSSNFTELVPPSRRAYLDADISEPPEIPLVFFGSSSNIVGDKLYMYGGAAFLPFNTAPIGLSLLRIWDINERRWLPFQNPVGAPASQRSVFSSTTYVDGTKIWYFGGSLTTPVLCYLETAETPLRFECPVSSQWAAVVGAKAGLGIAVVGRTAWLFGGATTFSITLVAADTLFAFNLDTYELTAYYRPEGNAQWPAGRTFSCMAPIGASKVLLYGGATSFQDQGTLREVWLLDTTVTDPNRLWSLLTIPVSNIPLVSGWASCHYFQESLIVFSGTTGFGVSQGFVLAQTDLDPKIQLDAISILRLNATDPSSSKFEKMRPENGYDFAGWIPAIRVGHSAALTPDGSHLIFANGFALTPRAETGDGSEMYSERHLMYLRLGCPAGFVPNTNASHDDPYSFRCSPVPAGTYQPQSYAKDIFSVSSVPCPARTFSDVPGAAFCKFCPLGFTSTQTGLTSPSQCVPCPPGTVQKAPGGDCEPQASVAAIVSGVVVSIAVLGTAAAVVTLLLLRRWRRKVQAQIDSPSTASIDASAFNFAFLKASDIIFGEELGRGSYGTVFKGTYNGRAVAIKVSRPGMEEALRDFLREAEVMMKIEPHKNVVSLVGVALDAGSALVLLEYCDGGSLDQALRNGYQLSPLELPEFLQQIVGGLKHIHRSKLIHRDLASRNILLHKDPTTGRYIPKVADFGLSRALSSDQQDAIGQTKTNFGPIPWLSPEALTNLSYSRRSDIWSFGILVWEIISGLDPAQQMDLVTLAREIRDNGFHPFIPPFIPDYLVEIMEGCWQFNPRERISLDDILDILSEVQLLASPEAARNGGGAAGKKRSKAPGNMSKQELSAEIDLVRSKTQILEDEIADILAEIDVFERELRDQRKKKKKNAKRNKLAGDSDKSSESEVEMEPTGFTGYISLPADEETAPVQSPKDMKKKKKKSDGVYGAVPAQEEREEAAIEADTGGQDNAVLDGRLDENVALEPETKRRKNRLRNKEAQDEDEHADEASSSPYVSLPATSADSAGAIPRDKKKKRLAKEEEELEKNDDDGATFYTSLPAFGSSNDPDPPASEVEINPFGTERKKKKKKKNDKKGKERE